MTGPGPRNLSGAATGAVYAVLAFSAWGLLPIYWKLFSGLPATEILAHRMLWALPFTLGLLLLKRRSQALIDLIRSPRRLALLAVTASLLALNWGVYIHGVNTARVVETSLGYFINPLVNVMLGFVFLRERFNGWQILALCLATGGVSFFIWDVGRWPWIALTLAFTFGFYGLLRKVSPAGSLAGLAGETLVLAPLAAAYLVWLQYGGRSHFGQAWPMDLALVGAGAVTALPLLWFAEAARRMRLSTIGLFQYLAPTLQLLLGVLVYGEAFTRTHVIAFTCIWIALAIYSWNGWVLMQRRRAAERAAAPAQVSGAG